MSVRRLAFEKLVDRCCEKAEVEAEGFVDFVFGDELVGSVGTCGIAGTHFEGGEGHEGLVAQGGGAEGGAAEGYSCADKGMIGREA